MPTTPATVDPTTRTADEQFLALICSDAELLAAEFEAIIAAEWPAPPADRPGRGAADGGQPGRGAVRRAAACGPVSPPRHRDVGGWARQRSPPFGHPTYDKQEGR